MTFHQVGSFHLPELERTVIERWRQLDIPSQVADLRRDGKDWIFYEGPPTANGKPGLHHVWARVFKDVFPRFQTMRGHKVPRRGGWDCHGLPVELEVEKEIGISGKSQIEDYGVAAFTERCRESVVRYVSDWTELTERSGVWIDTDDAYWTMSNDYIESIWSMLKSNYDRSLLSEGYRVSPYCPRCGTTLSSHEMGQPDVYKDVEDLSIYARFALSDTDADLLVWTTTPWTLLSNVAVAVHPDMKYVRIRIEGERDLVLSETRLEPLGIVGEIVDRLTGADLLDRTYERPFDVVTIPDHMRAKALRVVAGDFVNDTDGSGLVHIAPAFGEDDARLAEEHDLPTLNPIDGRGLFTEAAGAWAARHVDDVGPDVVEDLRARGLLLAAVPYEHSYPHCWRCDTRLIYWAKNTWFLRTSHRRSELLDANDTINWYPEHIKNGRFGRWLESNVDWALSRDRYWGTPLPIWRCPSGHDTCIGSRRELAELGGGVEPTNLHRPEIDDFTIDCPTCGSEARRLLPVLDAWFDSGAMPLAQQHYPFAGQPTTGTPPNYPADFICEAIDQTRGWFYSLLAANVLTTGEAPYRNVVCLGHIVDQDGKKMSKSRGNALDPYDVFGEYGADGVRWYFFSTGQPWSPKRVNLSDIRESTNRTLSTLWNAVSFFASYAGPAGWQPSTDREPTNDELDPLDRWILSRLDSAVEGCTKALDDFDALSGSGFIVDIVDDLSNWYIRRSRSRFWTDQVDEAAFFTLHRCLTTTAELLAPFCPFLADEIWIILTGGASVHLADWPTPTGCADPTLEEQVDAARRLASMGRSARRNASVKVRQPLRTAYLHHPGVELDATSRELIAAEINVMDLEPLVDEGAFVEVIAQLNFRELGPRYGERMPELKRTVEEQDAAELETRLEADGRVLVSDFELLPSDVTFRRTSRPGFEEAERDGWRVVLATELDDELLVAGTARELSRLLNSYRRDIGLEIVDRIAIEIEAADDGRVADALDIHGAWIATETLANSIVRTGVSGTEMDVNGETITVTAEREAHD